MRYRNMLESSKSVADGSALPKAMCRATSPGLRQCWLESPPSSTPGFTSASCDGASMARCKLNQKDAVCPRSIMLLMVCPGCHLKLLTLREGPALHLRCLITKFSFFSSTSLPSSTS